MSDLSGVSGSSEDDNQDSKEEQLGIEGISGLESESKVEQIETLLERAGLEDDDLDIEELAEAVKAEDELEGIGVVPEPSAVRKLGQPLTQAVSRQRLAQQIANQQQQLAQLDDVEQGLLQMISQLQTLNQGILRVISAVESINQKTQLASANLKDFNSREINKVNIRQDVTAEPTLQTSRVLVKASPSNSDSIYVGNDTTQVNKGFEIEPGEKETFPVNLADFPFKVVGETVGDSYTYISFGPE